MGLIVDVQVHPSGGLRDTSPSRSTFPSSNPRRNDPTVDAAFTLNPKTPLP